MGVRTTADECIDSAVGHMHDAATQINRIVLERVWGADEMSQERLARLRQMCNTLLEFRDELNQ